MTDHTVLEIQQLSVVYGRLTAVRDVNLRVRAGSVVAVVGPNGAGKTTTLAAVAGGIKVSAGRILLDGVSITGLRPDLIAAKGVSLVPEGRRVFSTLTVEENLRMGSYMRGDAWAASADLGNVLGYFPRLKDRLRESGGKLSGGEQQMLVIARALMTRPRLLLVDEPSLGLAPRIVDEVYEILLALRKSEGLTLLINEQSSKRVLRFSDEIYILRDGKVQLSGSTSSFREGTEISDAYFGLNSFSSATENASAQ